ncbi:GWxTD domain-containing protein [Flavobacteriales bacterium]|nr:GWxTD domain-containing protein [Flavobacteriales bacterium]
MLFTGYNVKHLLPVRWFSGWLALLPLLAGPQVYSLAQAPNDTPSLRLATRQFQSPDGAPYLEVQAEFLASSVRWLAEGDSVFRAAVKWTAIAYDSTGAVAGFVKSTARTGFLPQKGDFVDVARIALSPGPHVLELEVEDVGAPERPHLEYETVVEVSSPAPLDISDLFVVQGVAPASVPAGPLTRSGKDILPLLDRRVSAEALRIPFYCELYGTETHFGAGGAFLVVAGFKSPGADGQWVDETKRFFRMSAAPVLPLLESLPPPPAGSYELVVQIMTPEQSLLVANSVALRCVSEEAQNAAVAAGSLAPFVLEHQDRDSLLALIESLIPIADAGERRSIEHVLQGADLRQLRSFLEHFWTVRSPDRPADAWRTYRTEVAIADREYGACPNREGHETDMGWILLRYGRPNTIVQRHNGTAYYPYEIWHYHKAGQFNNRRFLFYTPQVVGECFELLHSDHPRELRNADWLDILKTRELGHSVVDSRMNQLGNRDTYSREEPEDLFFNPR